MPDNPVDRFTGVVSLHLVNNCRALVNASTLNEQNLWDTHIRQNHRDLRALREDIIRTAKAGGLDRPEWETDLDHAMEDCVSLIDWARHWKDGIAPLMQKMPAAEAARWKDRPPEEYEPVLRLEEFERRCYRVSMSLGVLWQLRTDLDKILSPPQQPHPATGRDATVLSVTPPQTFRFELSSGVWQIAYRGDTRTIPDTLKGLSYYARLLDRPNRVLTALEIEGQDPKMIPSREDSAPMMTGEAINSAKDRLAEIDEELREASNRDDAETDTKLREERDRITRELKSAVGAHGKSRPLGATEASRAAGRVKSALRTVREKLRGDWNLPSLADHLEKTVAEVGDDFIYRPGEPPPDWKVAF